MRYNKERNMVVNEYFQEMLLRLCQNGGGLALMRGVFEMGKGKSHQAKEIIQTQRTIDSVEIFFFHGQARHQPAAPDVPPQQG